MEEPIAQTSQKGSTEDVTFACLWMLMLPWMKREEKSFNSLRLSTQGGANGDRKPKPWIRRITTSWERQRGHLRSSFVLMFSLKIWLPESHPSLSQHLYTKMNTTLGVCVRPAPLGAKHSYPGQTSTVLFLFLFLSRILCYKRNAQPCSSRDLLPV